jgi:hypothetical protein
MHGDPNGFAILAGDTFIHCRDLASDAHGQRLIGVNERTTHAQIHMKSRVIPSEYNRRLPFTGEFLC